MLCRGTGHSTGCKSGSYSVGKISVVQRHRPQHRLQVRHYSVGRISFVQRHRPQHRLQVRQLQCREDKCCAEAQVIAQAASQAATV